MQKLTIIRGIPGSGKSTLAKVLLAEDRKAVHFETDQYFYKSGKYYFKKSKLKEYHARCLEDTTTALLDGLNVIVSNTFIKIWEVARYLEITRHVHNLDVEIIRCLLEFKNVHGVPDAVVRRMKRDYQPLVERKYYPSI